MNSLAFVLFGKDTLEEVEIGYGAPHREQWSLERHPGLRMYMRALGGEEGAYRYLYPDHLKLLYARFAAANPGGMVMGVDDVVEAAYEREHGLTSKQVEALTEQDLLYVPVTSEGELVGLPYLRRYLPEVFEPAMVGRMQADPWLDAHLLERALGAGAVPDGREMHPRWSPEWRGYCDRLRPSAGLV
ncbi:hypothetical protein [Nevskia soli]|uniref:hypothetical protein n=1 Tax=Nevskia soli TaxID=418856 RepID=UPI0004A73441|nr:hypothetical protein [Nevskia soli]